jgi:hypothetical protein
MADKYQEEAVAFCEFLKSLATVALEVAKAGSETNPSINFDGE